jgi:RNA polymerase sigma factor (sigma-70 family)
LAEDRIGAFSGDTSPLLSNDPGVWDRIVEMIGPASILVVIEARMSSGLKKRMSPEDVWQDTLMHVWRDRDQCEWRGIRAFRSWVLTVADNRIRDAAQRESAKKRGGGAPAVAFSALGGGTDSAERSPQTPGPVGSTTPSRIAMHAEQAAAMRAALDSLPDDVREIVRLRLFEQVSVENVASRLGIGASAVRHRFRKGAGIYRRRLTRAIATRTETIPREITNTQRRFSSSEE